jgi:hypothetical protein
LLWVVGTVGCPPVQSWWRVAVPLHAAAPSSAADALPVMIVLPIGRFMQLSSLNDRPIVAVCGKFWWTF